MINGSPLSTLKSPEARPAQAETTGFDRTRSRAAQTNYLDVANISLTLAVVVSLVFLFLSTRDRTRLQQKILDLEKSNRQLDLSVSDRLSGPPFAQPGDMVPPFEAADLDGNKIVVTYDGSARRLLFIFSPVCSVCVEEVPKWNQIAQLARSRNFSAFGVSLKAADLTKASLPDVRRDFDVLIMPTMAIQRGYRVVAEPVVFLISKQGTVDWVHYGRLNDQRIAELSSLIQANQSH